MFPVGIPEGLPPPIAPEPECRPRRPRPQPGGLRPHPIPISIKVPIFRNFDHFSDHYRRENPTRHARRPFVVCEWLQHKQNVVVNEQGRQVITWHYLSNLNQPHTSKIMDTIRWTVDNRLRINYWYYCQLQKTENNKKVPY